MVRAQTLNRDLDRISEWAQKWKVSFNETKTELLNFVRGAEQLYPLWFGSTFIDNSEEHKHLGVIFQSNCKWDTHIKTLASKVSILISCLKSYKYRLSRKSLEAMYKSFVMPHFDYACIVWDNCTETLSNLLENLHLEALRIVTGSVKGTSHQKLYEESGFCSLRERRRRLKLLAFKKITLGIGPDYLLEMLPPLVSSVNPYHRRRPHERVVPSFKTELFRNSFFPSVTRLWNELPDFLKTTASLSEFKHSLSSEDSTVPKYYYIGQRLEQLTHCRLRLGMSNLNNDLVNRHLREDRSCACGSPVETAEHYLLACHNFSNIRRTTISTLLPGRTDIDTLLFGNPRLRNAENEEVFHQVHCFIRLSKRFE